MRLEATLTHRPRRRNSTAAVGGVMRAQPKGFWIAVGILALHPGAARCGTQDAAVVALEDRVAAQRAIERVYYAHQTLASQPFDKAVPAEVIRAKALRGLELSAALDRYWKTTLTAEMLDAEIERMRRHTRMPERLREL